VSISPEGQIMHAGDFANQARLVFENLRTVLQQAGASMTDVVKLGVFLTHMARMPEYNAAKAEFFTGAQPASTAVGVTSLAAPGLMIEVEAVRSCDAAVPELRRSPQPRTPPDER
jgi:enamine deaminase RidA (YjgF/YER057c/UK114 family)